MLLLFLLMLLLRSVNLHRRPDAVGDLRQVSRLAGHHGAALHYLIARLARPFLRNCLRPRGLLGLLRDTPSVTGRPRRHELCVPAFNEAVLFGQVRSLLETKDFRE